MSGNSTKVDTSDRDMRRSNVRSAMSAASQLPGALIRMMMMMMMMTMMMMMMMMMFITRGAV